MEKSTPEIARELVVRLSTVHGLSGSGLLSHARKILKVEMVNLDSAGKVK